MATKSTAKKTTTTTTSKRAKALTPADSKRLAKEAAAAKEAERKAKRTAYNAARWQRIKAENAAKRGEATRAAKREAKAPDARPVAPRSVDLSDVGGSELATLEALAKAFATLVARRAETK